MIHIDGVKYVVVTEGDRQMCIDVMNFSIKRIRENRLNGYYSNLLIGIHAERDILK